MRLLKWLAVILVLAAGGGWFAVAALIEKGAAAALEDLRAKGTTVESSAPAVSGFPTEWRLSLSDLRIADPVSGAGWQGPSFSLRADSYAPWHVTASLPDQQVITLPGQTITLQSQGMAVAVGSAPDPDLPLRTLTVTAFDLTAQSDMGWTLALQAASFAMAADDSRPPGAYLLALELGPLTPDPAFMDRLAQVALPGLPAPDFPPQAEMARARIGLRLTAPLDRHTDTTRPQVQAVEITGLDLGWGKLTLHAEGMVEADAEGYAAGRVMLKLTNWDRLPALLVALGAIKSEIAPTVAGGLKAMAAQSPDPAVLALALDMKDGRMSLGPFPLGEAPRLRPPQS